MILASDEEEDETAELLRELEKIKRERAERREQEVGCSAPFVALKSPLMAGVRNGRKPKPSRPNENTTSLLVTHC